MEKHTEYVNLRYATRSDLKTQADYNPMTQRAILRNLGI